MKSDEVGHVTVESWVTLPGEENQIAVVIDHMIDEDGELEELVRILRWDENLGEWTKLADWTGRTDTAELYSDDPRLPDAQRGWSRRQMDAIMTTGWTDGKGEDDENRE